MRTRLHEIGGGALHSTKQFIRRVVMIVPNILIARYYRPVRLADVRRKTCIPRQSLANLTEITPHFRFREF
jgi:hypothetical protein